MQQWIERRTVLKGLAAISAALAVSSLGHPVSADEAEAERREAEREREARKEKRKHARR